MEHVHVGLEGGLVPEGPRAQVALVEAVGSLMGLHVGLQRPLAGKEHLAEWALHRLMEPLPVGSVLLDSPE